MKELDDFTVERLLAITQQPDSSTIFMYEVRSLARIALAAKTATPAYWITYYPNPDQNEFDDREHSHSGAKSCAVRIAGEIGGFVVPVYHGVPPVNSPELPDGWKLMPIAPTPEMEQAISDGIYNDLYTSGIYADLLAAAPTPPTTEK